MSTCRSYCSMCVHSATWIYILGVGSNIDVIRVQVCPCSLLSVFHYYKVSLEEKLTNKSKMAREASTAAHVNHCHRRGGDKNGGNGGQRKLVLLVGVHWVEPKSCDSEFETYFRIISNFTGTAAVSEAEFQNEVTKSVEKLRKEIFILLMHERRGTDFSTTNWRSHTVRASTTVLQECAASAGLWQTPSDHCGGAR